MEPSLTDLGLADPGRLFRLREWHHMDNQEIADWFGITREAVRQRFTDYHADQIEAPDLIAQIGHPTSTWTEHRDLIEDAQPTNPLDFFRDSVRMGTLMVARDFTVREVAYVTNQPEHLVRMWAGVHDIHHYTPPEPDYFTEFDRQEWSTSQPPSFTAEIPMKM
jgi:hypothetical protein